MDTKMANYRGDGVAEKQNLETEGCLFTHLIIIVPHRVVYTFIDMS
jgi:hypothetical protein